MTGGLYYAMVPGKEGGESSPRALSNEPNVS